METKVLTNEELQSLKDLQTSKNGLATNFGIIEYEIQSLELQKKILISNMSSLKEQENKISKELQTKYGEGNINLSTGEFVSIN